MQLSATRLTFLALLAVSAISRNAWAGAESKPAETPETVAGQRIAAAYPEAIEKIDGNWLVWRDGTRMPLDDGVSAKSFTAWLDNPDIEDMLRLPYVAGAGPAEPAPDDDPGRARNAALFDKMYGDCRKDEVKGKLTAMVWMPRAGAEVLFIQLGEALAQLDRAGVDDVVRIDHTPRKRSSK